MRARAHDLIEQKVLFEVDLKIALEKYSHNHELLLIADVMNDVFHPRKQDNDPVNKNQTCSEQNANASVIKDDYFQLRCEDIQEMDLVSYVTTTKQITDDFYPSFSLGIDDDIYDKQCEDVNANDEADLKAEATDEEMFITPKPAIREKSTRLMKLNQYDKSPYIQRVIDISAKFTNLDFGIWRFMVVVPKISMG